MKRNWNVKMDRHVSVTAIIGAVVFCAWTVYAIGGHWIANAFNWYVLGR